MYNRVILMGRIVKDPELSTTQSGVTMCRIRIAVDRSFVRQGEERQSDFFDITLWRQQAEFVCKYFTKGRMIHVEGRIQNNNYTDQQTGKTVYRDQIVADNVTFCGDKRSDNGGGGNFGGQNYGGGNYGGGQPYGGNNYGGGQNYGGNSYGGNQGGYQQQNAPAPRPAAPAPQAAVNQAPNPIELGDLGDFEEILSDGEVPF